MVASDGLVCAAACGCPAGGCVVTALIGAVPWEAPAAPVCKRERTPARHGLDGKLADLLRANGDISVSADIEGYMPSSGDVSALVTALVRAVARSEFMLPVSSDVCLNGVKETASIPEVPSSTVPRSRGEPKV